MLPRVFARKISQYRAQQIYEKDTHSVYLKTRLAHFSGTFSPQAPTSARSFLFVCHGNIMRSPMCEALMKRALADRGDYFRVISAGLNANPGRRAHPWAISSAVKFGISLEQHHALVLTFEMVQQADLIFAMDLQNRVELLSRFPQAKEKLFLLGMFRGPDGGGVEIHDPYHLGEDGTQRCYQILDICIRNLAFRISPTFTN
jgi:protein-tyrosine phosphatase